MTPSDSPATVLDLDELERLLTKATPAPWTAGDYEGETSFGVHGGGPDAPHDYNVCEIAWWCGADKECHVNREDGYLIAALHNAAPELIKRARERDAIVAREEQMKVDLYAAHLRDVERAETAERERDELRAIVEAARAMVAVCQYPCGDPRKCGNCNALRAALAGSRKPGGETL